MSKPCDTHLSDTDRETVSLGRDPWPIVADNGEGIRAVPQHREP